MASALIGQSYRFQTDNRFGSLSGLNGHVSDYVGELTLNPNRYISLLYRFRLDKDNLTPRQNELTTTLGAELFRVTASYLNIPPSGIPTPRTDLTLLQQPLRRQELYAAVSSQFSRYWAVTVAHRENLGPGGGSVRSDVLLKYEDECFGLGVDISRNYITVNDFHSGLNILFRLTIKTIGDVHINSGIGGF
jgi:LPS-assembly protein